MDMVTVTVLTLHFITVSLLVQQQFVNSRPKDHTCMLFVCHSQLFRNFFASRRLYEYVSV
jgi:hypothetical protein